MAKLNITCRTSRVRLAVFYRTWVLLVGASDGEELSEYAVALEVAVVVYDITAPEAPPGRLDWVGRDPLVRTDLGERLLLMWTEP